MKRLALIVPVLLVCVFLSACCLSHEWQDATCEEPKTCSKCGETEGEALEHEGEWIVISEDFVSLERKSRNECINCGKKLDTKSEEIDSLVSDNLFLFTGREYTERLQNVYNKRHKDDLELSFKYAVNKFGYWNTDIYYDDMWLAWIVFYNEDGEALDGSEDNTRNINSMRLILPYEDEENLQIYYEVFGLFVDAMSAATDPSLTDDSYADPIMNNVYCNDGENNQTLHGLFYSCGLDGEDAELKFDIDIKG